MTFTALATPVPNTKILVSTFGALVKQDLDDLDGRVTAINTNLGTWSGGTAISRIQQLETSHSLRYERTTAAQTITSGVDTVITWPVTVRTDNSVITYSAGNFTVAKSGWVDVMTSLRMAAGTTSMEYKIKLNGNRVAGTAVGANLQAGIAAGFPVVIGDVITIVVFHNTGSNRNTETGAENQNNVSISWRGI